MANFGVTKCFSFLEITNRRGYAFELLRDGRGPGLRPGLEGQIRYDSTTKIRMNLAGPRSNPGLVRRRDGIKKVSTSISANHRRGAFPSLHPSNNGPCNAAIRKSARCISTRGDLSRSGNTPRSKNIEGFSSTINSSCAVMRSLTS